VKKIACIILVCVITITLAIMNIPTGFAEATELLPNPSFANGTTGWTASGCQMAQEYTIKQDTVGNSILLSNRQSTYASMRCQLASIVNQNGSGDYLGSAWLRLADGANPTNIKLVYSVTYNGATTYKSGQYITVTDDAWVHLSVLLDNVVADANLTEVKFYFTQNSSDTIYPSVYLDNCSFMKIIADPDELLANPTFAYGQTGWTTSGCQVAEEHIVRKDNLGSSLLISSRQNYYASMRCLLTNVVLQNGSGEYHSSAWLRLADGASSVNIKLVFSVTYNGITTWQSGQYTTVTDAAWVNLIANLDVVADQSLGEVKFYFVQSSNDTIFPNVYLDNCSFMKIDPVITPGPTVPVPTAIPASQIQGADHIRIGAIRWDAWVPADPEGEGTDVGGEVAAALDPEEYRSRAPFFSILDNNDHLDFPTYTMDIWEQEADYAINAGIDYFAYGWYMDSSPMSLARKYHTQSTKNEDIQMCAILGVTGFTATERNQLFAAMEEDYYLKVDNMPLVYIYGGMSAMDADDIALLRTQAANAGLPPLYIVSMVSSSQPDSLTALSSGYDALSFYSYPVSNGPWTYAQLADNAETRNETLGLQTYLGQPIQMIPSITTGRDVRPRIDNPPSWVEDYGEYNYAELGTAQQIADHMSNVLEWTLDNPEVTVADCVISYAWNEHDEGGWMCPTIQEDQNGDLMVDQYGNFVPDTSRLDAIETAITAFRLLEDE